MIIDTAISVTALVVSIVSLGFSIFFWLRSFRPIVTAMVKTHTGGNVAILYDLELLNSGLIPATDIKLKRVENSLEQAFGLGASEEEKKRWLACFEPSRTIKILHNEEKVKCAFGNTKAKDAGFWKYGAKISIEIEYKGWFKGWCGPYIERQEIEIINSESFTGYYYGDKT